VDDIYTLPADLPIPHDDGAADHLPGAAVPNLALPSTAGETVELASPEPGRTVLYVYPLTGRPGEDIPEGWNAIPGARGCTTEACDFRDHHEELLAAGAVRVFGLSSQDTAYQRELVERLRLPFSVLSDTGLRLAEELRLPTFEARGRLLYKRITLVIRDSTVEHAFYPVFPPDRHAGEVLAWLKANPVQLPQLSR
jgi:peroxiredoxin